MSTTRRRISEAERFSQALLSLRKERKWSQDTLARQLGVSKRMVSNWECGYELPHFNKRAHVVVSLLDQPPQHVLEIADALAVSVQPGIAPLLQSLRDALEGRVATTVARPAPEVLRQAVDALVREAADHLDVTPNGLRAALGKVVAACAELGGTLGDLKDAVAVKPPPKRSGTVEE